MSHTKNSLHASTNGKANLCAHCRKPHGRIAAAVNRAAKLGVPLYCGRRCSGLGRRKGKTKAQKVAEKRLYDMAYRAKNRELLKAKKAAYFQRALYTWQTQAKYRGH